MTTAYNSTSIAARGMWLLHIIASFHWAKGVDYEDNLLVWVDRKRHGYMLQTNDRKKITGRIRMESNIAVLSASTHVNLLVGELGQRRVRTTQFRHRP